MSFFKKENGKSKKTFKKNYYLKVLLNYFAFTLAMLVLTFYLSTQIFLPGFERKIEESNLNLLRYVQSYTDEKIKSSTVQVISRYFIDVPNPHLVDFFSQQISLSSEIIINSFQTINYIAQTHDYIESIYLYRHFDNTFLSTSEGLSYDITSIKSGFSTDIAGLINEVSSYDVQPVWLSPEKTSLYFKDTSIISYATNIPLRFSNGSNSGVIIINLNQEKLFASVQEIYGEKGMLLMLARDGELFSHNYADNAKSQKEICSQIAPIISIEDEGFNTLAVQNESFGMVWLRSDTYDWVYVYLIPLSEMNRNIAESIRLVVFIFIGVFLLAICILNIMTFRLHRPLRKLVSVINDSTNIKSSDSDDFGYMENVFSYLSGRVGEMEKTVQSNKTHLRYMAFIDILYAAPNQSEMPQNNMELFSSEFTDENFQLIMLEIDHSVFSKLESEQREFMIIKVKEHVETFLLGHGASISICHPANCVVSLLNYQEAEVLKNDARLLLESLRREMGAYFNVFISDQTKDLAEISVIYSKGREALGYQYIYNYGNIFKSEDTLVSGEFSIQMEQEFFDKVHALLLANQTTQLFVILEEKIAGIRASKPSYQYVDSFCMHLSHRIAQTCKHLGIELDIEEKEELTKRFKEINSLDSYVDWICLLVIFHSEKIGSRSTTIHNDFILRIAAYVDEHLEEDISLKVIAGHFHLSPSHLSRMFKEGLNTNFQEYIFDKKLERAAWYLKNKPEMNVNKIASVLGYMTPAYFSRIFKGKYGVTPSQYRKKMHTGNF